MPKQPLLAALTSLLLPLAAFGQAPTPKADFGYAMRKLWEHHITWTRCYIISATSDLPDKDATAKRLLQNQTDIGQALKPYYGDAAAEKITALLQDHIKIATEVIDAAKRGDDTKKTDAMRRWQSNADDIAGFLSSANEKNWPTAEMKYMMREHLDATTQEVVARLKKDWDADIQAYDRVHEQIVRMADMLSWGVIRQFPERFN